MQRAITKWELYEKEVINQCRKQRGKERQYLLQQTWNGDGVIVSNREMFKIAKVPIN